MAGPATGRPNRSSPGSRRSVTVLITACLLLALSLWTLVPAPTLRLLPLSVGVPELGHWLAALALLTALTTLFDLRGRTVARVALAIALTAAVLAAMPLVRVAGVARNAERGMRAAFGDGYASAIPEQARHDIRPSPVVPLDLIRGLPPDTASEARVLFTSPGGTELAMTIYRPASPGPHPGVVQIHGGAWQAGSGDDDSAAARYFAARNYVVFAIGYRLAPAFRWPAQIDDVRAATAWIHAHGAEHGADPARLAYLGRSAGAQLALVAAYAPGGVPAPRSVVSYYGPTDLAEGYRDLPRPDPIGVRSVLEAYLGGPPDSSPAAYRDASPVSYATARLPPTLLVHGGRDRIVLPRFARLLHDRLRVTGTPAVLIELPWADHAFDAVPFGPGAQLTLYYVERFLALTLR